MEDSVKRTGNKKETVGDKENNANTVIDIENKEDYDTIDNPLEDNDVQPERMKLDILFKWSFIISVLMIFLMLIAFSIFFGISIYKEFMGKTGKGSTP